MNEKLDTIFEAARLAPSAKNLQDWRFIVVTDKAGKGKLAQAAGGQKFVAHVPISKNGFSKNGMNDIPIPKTGSLKNSTSYQFLEIENTR